jgi:hypothetical protein
VPGVAWGAVIEFTAEVDDFHFLSFVFSFVIASAAKQSILPTVIPGRCEASNPES